MTIVAIYYVKHSNCPCENVTNRRSNRKHKRKETSFYVSFLVRLSSKPVAGGSGGIRTHVPLEAVTAFRVRAVMTTSIRFRIKHFLVLYYCSLIRLWSIIVVGVASLRLATTSLVCACATFVRPSDEIRFRIAFI